MKVICLQENLQRGLESCERIIGRNLTLPILNNVLIKKESGMLKLTTTNLEISINSFIVGKIDGEESIVVPIKIISNIIKNLPKEKITLEIKNKILSIKTEKFKSIIKGVGDGDFPIIPKIKENFIFKIPSPDLLQGLNKVVGSVSFNESRPEITGVLFKITKDKTYLAATDSFRLTEVKIPILSEKEFSFILPLKTTQELIRISSLDNEDIELVLGNNQILFKTPHTHLTSRLIDGHYPDYEQIIPSKFETELIFDKNEFLNAVRVVSFMSGQIKDVKLEIGGADIKISAADPDLGENVYTVESRHQGKETIASFNHQYLRDGVSMFDSDELIMRLNGDAGPSLFRSNNEAGHLYLIMPIKGR